MLQRIVPRAPAAPHGACRTVLGGASIAGGGDDAGSDAFVDGATAGLAAGLAAGLSVLVVLVASVLLAALVVLVTSAACGGGDAWRCDATSASERIARAQAPWRQT